MSTQTNPPHHPGDPARRRCRLMADTPGAIGRWLRFETDGTVTLLTGKVEIGQGIHTALAQCVADELDLPFDRVRVAPPDTAHSPDEGYTAGSMSIERSGEALRQVCAETRALFHEALDRGLVTMSYSHVIRINPPLVITEDEALRGVDILDQSLGAIAKRFNLD